MEAPSQQEYFYPQQETKPVNADEVYANIMQEERVKNVIAQLSPDNQLMEMHWRIRGYIQDPITKDWIKLSKDSPEPHPLLVARFISYLSSLLNQNVTMSNYSPDEINSIMGLCIDWIADDLDAHADEYGIGKNYTERTRIGHIVLNQIFASMKRAVNGTESRRTFSALSLMENMSQNQPEKKGFMESLKFWK